MARIHIHRTVDATPRKLADALARLARRRREALSLSALCGCRIRVTRSGAFIIAADDLRRLASVRDEAEAA